MNVFHIILVWVHLIAATFWVGGMLFLSLVAVPLVKQDSDPTLVQRWFITLARRFRNLVWVALSILVISGFFLLSRLVVLASSPLTWPSSILVKLSLVLALIGTSYLHDQVIGPKVRALKMKTVLTLTSQEQFLVRFSPLLGRLALLLGLAVLLAAVVVVRI